MSPHTAPSEPAILSVLKSREFRQAYHEAVDRLDLSHAAQEITARQILEAYFGLEPVDSTAPLRNEAVYFTAHAVDVHGHAKFLVPGTVHFDNLPGPLFRLTQKAPLPEVAVAPTAAVESFVQFKDFGRAIASVEAVRLTLVPERVNGIISFIADAKQHYAAGEVDRAERSIGIATDHFDRAAGDGLRRISSEAERGKRGNDLAGTRRRLAELRRKLQQECDQVQPPLR